MKRRRFIAALSAIASARSILEAAGAERTRLGICAFSCHQHWKAAGAGETGVKFKDTIGFYRYARELGFEGVQTSLRPDNTPTARAIRDIVELDIGYYEGEVRLPKADADLAAFEESVKRVREAGAGVARTVFTSGRRYEVFKTAEEFRAFQDQAKRSLELAEPVLARHRLRLAVENHKDLTTDELLGLMHGISSEWVGVLVDTGNNIALLEEPHAVVEALAPFVLSVHLKDMAVKPYEEGFLLSEVPLGTGALDLTRMTSTLTKANPALVFNLEMATRDPLRVPCLTDAYFTTFPGRKAERLAPMMDWVKAHPPKAEPPSVSGKPVAQILAEEEANNRHGFGWMGKNLAGFKG